MRIVVCGLLLIAGALLSAPPARAQYATGGSGQYRSNIMWFRWGDNGAAIPQAGLTVTNKATVAGAPLDVICGLSAISGPSANPDLRVYRPGGYFEDGLPYLYNVGGVGGQNTMDIGVMHRTPVSSATFTFTCSATLAGSSIPIDGLVFADAETTNSSEYIETTLPAGATMRVIERYRASACTTGYEVVRGGAGGNNYTFRSMDPYSCWPAYPSAMGVYFLDNATSATVSFGSQGGLQSIALGVMLNVADYGDAPTSYGIAAHLPQYAWSGGVLPVGTTNIFGATFNVATQTMPVTARLGALVDTELQSAHGASANGDDADSRGDEDGVSVSTLTPLLVGRRGLSYTVPVACVGNSPVAAWIDFDRDNVFQADERSATASCAAGSASLVWTIPSDVVAGNSFLRVRTAVASADIANPTGVASSGEVEDYAITIFDPKVRIAKTTVGRVGGPFTFAATNTLTQPSALSTTAVNTATTATPLSITNLAAPVTITEVPLGAWSLASIQCSDTAGGAAIAATVNLAARQLTIPTSALTATTDITCNFTNNAPATLRVQKTRIGNAGPSQIFSFSGNGPGTGMPGDDSFNFSLNNQSSQTHDYGTVSANTASPGTSELNNLVSGTYVITESFIDTPANDYELTSVSCVNQPGGAIGSSVATALGANGGTATITLVPGANYLCTFVNTRNPIVVLTKQVQGAGATFDFGVGATGTGLVTPSAPSLLVPSDGSAQVNINVATSVSLSRDVTISEPAPPSGYVLTSATCTKVRTSLAGGTTVSNYVGNLTTRQVVIVDFTPDDTASCTFVNAEQSTVVFRKQSLGGTGSFSFGSGSNLATTAFTLNTSSTNPVSTGAIAFSVPGQAASIAEVIPVGWVLSDASCVDAANNPVSGVSLSGGVLSIPGGATVGGQALNCTFINTKSPTLQIQKQLPNGRFAVGDQFSLSISGAGGPATATTTGSGSAVVGSASITAATAGLSYTFSEAPSGGANLANYVSTYNCVNSAAGGTSVTPGSGTSFSVTPQAGDSFLCTFVNTRNPLVDLSIEKQNDSPIGGVVTSGTTTTYTLTVSNAGPDAANGATIVDTPTVGLNSCQVTGCTSTPAGATCPANGTPVPITGFTHTVSSFPAGATLRILISCQVN